MSLRLISPPSVLCSTSDPANALVGSLLMSLSSKMCCTSLDNLPHERTTKRRYVVKKMAAEPPREPTNKAMPARPIKKKAACAARGGAGGPRKNAPSPAGLPNVPRGTFPTQKLQKTPKNPNKTLPNPAILFLLAGFCGIIEADRPFPGCQYKKRGMCHGESGGDRKPKRRCR